MPSGGVIQGYNGIAVVDSLHQVVVDAQVIGEANEASSLQKAIAGVRETFSVIGEKRDIFEGFTVSRACEECWREGWMLRGGQRVPAAGPAVCRSPGVQEEEHRLGAHLPGAQVLQARGLSPR